MAPGPTTDQSSVKTMWIFVLVAGVVALGLNLFNYIRKPVPWQEALSGPFLPMSLILFAWARFLPATKPRAQRVLYGIACVLMAAALVLNVLDFLRP